MGHENLKICRYILVSYYNFRHFGGTVALKNQKAQTIKDFFGKIPDFSKRSPNVIATDGKEFFNKISAHSPVKNNIMKFSRLTSKSSAVAEMFDWTVRDLPQKKLILEGIFIGEQMK